MNSYHVQMEHVLMQVNDAMAKLIVEILLMKLIAVSTTDQDHRVILNKHRPSLQIKDCSLLMDFLC